MNNYQIPSPFQELLKPYQKQGVQFLLDNRKNGAILAHTMGTGKTLQAIVFLLSCQLNDPEQFRALVLMPKSLIDTWYSEIKYWLNRQPRQATLFRVANSDDNMEILSNIIGWSKKGGILLLHYDALPRLNMRLKTKALTFLKKPENSEWATFIDNALFGVDGPTIVICDEGHHLKNPRTWITKTIVRIKTPSKFILTGTPIQNNLTELFHLVNVVRPNSLGTLKEFVATFIKVLTPVNFIQNTQCQSTIQLLQTQLRSIMHQVGPEVLTQYLPQKYEYTILLRSTDKQQEVYIDTRREFMFDGTNFSAQLFDFYHRSLCLGYAHGAQIDQLCNLSPKINLMMQLVDISVRNKEKIVIFSQLPTALFSVLAELFRRRNYKYAAISGKLKVEERTIQIEKFKRPGECFILLSSLKVGGVGLTLTCANRLILMDVSWNPAVDSQAAGRVYRHGQPTETYIYRLISAGTIEEAIYHRQSAKLKLAGSIRENDGLASSSSAIASKITRKEVLKLCEFNFAWQDNSDHIDLRLSTDNRLKEAVENCRNFIEQII